MKNIITISILSSIVLIAGTPIHDKMDSRIKGKSYSGSLDDNTAAKDGLGILPLQHHSGTTEMNNELLVHKVFNRIVHTEIDQTKTIDVRTSLASGLVGTATDLNLLNNAGTTLSYVSGSLNSCKEIKTSFPTSTDGQYELKTIGKVYCDMTTDGGGWTLIVNSLSSSSTLTTTDAHSMTVKNSDNMSLTVEGISNFVNSNNWKDMMLYTRGYKVKGLNVNKGNQTLKYYTNITNNTLSTQTSYSSLAYADSVSVIGTSTIVGNASNGWPIRMGINAVLNETGEKAMLHYGASYVPNGFGTSRAGSSWKMDNHSSVYGDLGGVAQNWESASINSQQWFVR